MQRKILSIAYVLVGLILSLVFYSEIGFPEDVRDYFRIGFYRQFGHIAIAIELIIAGINLFVIHEKTNFAMGLFAFTATLDPIFNYFGILSSNVPVYGSIIFLCFAAISFWIAFTDAFRTGKISTILVVGTFLLGVIIELFFNYL